MHNVIKDLPTHILNPFKETHLDDAFSKVNRIYLFGICLAFGILTTIKQYTGHHIVCHGFTKYQHDFAEDFCWSQGLYTIKEAYDMPTSQVPYPGLVPEINVCLEFTYTNGTKWTCPDGIQPLTRLYHLWYQWIPFYFWLCAAGFYLPYLLFHSSEIGDIKPAIRLLHNTTEDNEIQLGEKIHKASVWLSAKIRVYLVSAGPLNFFLKRHKFFFVILFTKIANFLAVVLVLYATENMFQIGSFLTYGVDMISFNTEVDNQYQTNPKDKLFPKMIMCEIKRWGASGLEEEQGMCILAPNVVIQYFFLIFWFLLMMALVVNIFSLLFTTSGMLFTLGQYRRLLHHSFMQDNPMRKHVYFAIGTSGRVTMDILSHNIPPANFEKLYDSLCKLMVEDKGDKSNVYSNEQTLNIDS